MIESVVENLRPKTEHKFIFVALKEHLDKYDLYHVLQRATDNKFEVISLHEPTQGAACTVLTAINYINNDQELLIANGDQIIDGGIDGFIERARAKGGEGAILTFKSSHPKWSYARIVEDGRVVEVAEKRLISDNATAGLYYFKHGSDFVKAAQSMIGKDIRHNNEFYVAPTYNELIISGAKIYIDEIKAESMHGLGTPEDLNAYLAIIKERQSQ